MRTLKQMQTVLHKTKPRASCFISILCLQGHWKLQVHAEMYKFNAAHSSNSLTFNVIQPFPGCWGLCLKKKKHPFFSAGNCLFWPTLRLLSPAWLGTYHQIAAQLGEPPFVPWAADPTSSLRSLKRREIGGGGKSDYEITMGAQRGDIPICLVLFANMRFVNNYQIINMIQYVQYIMYIFWFDQKSRIIALLDDWKLFFARVC